jgi:hypothetical protein
MVELDQLKELIPFLKSQGVFSFKTQDLELVFHVERPAKTESKPDQDVIQDVPDHQLPVDLRTDNVNSFDSVLNWSASPAPEEIELPLTDDIPLSPDPITAGDLST